MTSENAEDRTAMFVDPGSRESGWCIARPYGDAGVSIIDAGTLNYLPEHGDNPYLRVADMLRALDALMQVHLPDDYVVEVTSGKVNRKRHKGGGAGLATFGMAVGALWTFGRMWRPPDGAKRPVVVPVSENLWKGGFGKLKSVLVTKRNFKKYAPQEDPEFNVADAVALAVWYFTLWLPKRRAAKR